MSNFCIVCEFNPFHNGHGYLLDEARRMGAETVTCIMSGNATQRGELAVTDKYLRARVAIECGADLVLELPFPWSSASADYFASAAVSVAMNFGDTLFFGSECGDIKLLTEAATVCETADFKAEFGERVKSGEGAAAAYSAALAVRGFAELSSNDLLGIAYIRAAERMGADMSYATVKRVGAAYNDDSIRDGEFPSATALRAAIESGQTDYSERLMPRVMADILRREIENGRITDMKEADSAYLVYFRMCSESELENIADAGGGIVNRLISSAKKSVSVEDMLSKARTKRYTDARLRRAALFCLTGTEAHMMNRRPEYTTLLGANTKGRELLSKNRRQDGISVITKPADAPRMSEQYMLSERLDILYGVARKNKMTSDEFFKKGAYIVR